MDKRKRGGGNDSNKPPSAFTLWLEESWGGITEFSDEIGINKAHEWWDELEDKRKWTEKAKELEEQHEAGMAGYMSPRKRKKPSEYAQSAGASASTAQAVHATNQGMRSGGRTTSEDGHGTLRLPATENRERGTNVSEDDSPETCGVHRQVYQFYCRTCRVPACSQCLLREHKINKEQHDIIGEDEVVAIRTKEVEELEEKLLHLGKQIEKIDRKLATSLEACIQKGAKMRKQIDEGLAEKQRQLIADAENLSREIGGNLKEQRRKFIDMQRLLEIRRTSLNESETELMNAKRRIAARGVSRESDVDSHAEKLEDLTGYLNSLEDASSTPNLELRFRPWSSGNMKVGSVFTTSQKLA